MLVVSVTQVYYNWAVTYNSSMVAVAQVDANQLIPRALLNCLAKSPLARRNATTTAALNTTTTMVEHYDDYSGHYDDNC